MGVRNLFLLLIITGGEAQRGGEFQVARGVDTAANRTAAAVVASILKTMLLFASSFYDDILIV